jgi:hypothetical protein
VSGYSEVVRKSLVLSKGTAIEVEVEVEDEADASAVRPGGVP